jgi:hypothetical protein
MRTLVTSTEVRKGSNCFGNWRINYWPPMFDEAPCGSYVVRWKDAATGEVGWSVHPTLQLALVHVPFTTERTDDHGNITAAR